MNTARHSLIALLLGLLIGCSGAPVTPPADPAVLEAEARLAIGRGNLEAAAAIYRRLAASVEGTAQNDYIIESARLETELGRPETALTTLAGARQPLTDSQSSELAAVRAGALFALGQTAEAVRLLVQREIWLDTSAAILANQALIWDGLALPASRLGAEARTGDRTIDGWLALAPFARMLQRDDSFLSGLIEWRDAFRGHPAESGILSEMLAARRGDGARPGKIALLLPLSSYRTESLAIRDGFLAAHLESGYADVTSVQSYDTALRGAAASYETAQLEGADFIVGPLVDSEVTQVLPLAGFVPTLALNVASASAAPVPAVIPANFYQYALSTDDEIEAIAARAVAAGHETAVILHELSFDGNRLKDSLAQAFQARGGRILNTAGYDPSPAATNHESAIKALLNVAQSEARASRLQRDLGIAIEFAPRRRADIDMIFLQTGPSHGRLLVQQLCRYDADGIPTYATSAIHDPNPSVFGGGGDLDSVMFPELPILAEPAGLAAGRALSEFSTDSAERAPRLFAFGFDAYELVERLYARGAAAWPMPGATGRIFLDTTGRIRRMLPFAELRNGRPAPADAAIGLNCVG
jgi:hypothetical protein